MSEYERVREFNRAAEQACPDEPSAMTADEVRFITKMMLDEIMELMITVTPNYKVEMIKMIGAARELEYKELSGDELIAEQGDALVDSNYYALNAAAKHGIQLDKIFDAVHEANMSKRDPATGKMLRREDGKIIKPEGWKAPDIVEVVRSMKPDLKQMKIDDYYSSKRSPRVPRTPHPSEVGDTPEDFLNKAMKNSLLISESLNESLSAIASDSGSKTDEQEEEN